MTNDKPMIVCVACGESRPKHSRGMCANCYQRRWKSGDLGPKPTTRVVRQCQTCGATIEVKANHVAMGWGKYCSRACVPIISTAVTIACTWCGEGFKVKPSHLSRNPRYCSRACRSQASVKPATPPKERPQSARIAKTCEYCGEGFTVERNRGKARYCSVQCRQKGHAVPRITAICQACGNDFQCYPSRPKPFCSKGCWEGTWTPSQDDDRRRNAARAWRAKVLQRDNYTCQHCGAHDRPLNAHHIAEWATHPHLRTVLSNGLTLCDACHFALHHPELANPYAA